MFVSILLILLTSTACLHSQLSLHAKDVGLFR